MKLHDPNTPPTLPAGIDPGDVTISGWEDYPGDYEKALAQVILRDGTFDPEWHWPNAGYFGDHPHTQIARVRYARWNDA